ncbi:unnamed protein product [Arctia plantaginis]|uniref:Uncharacterized protein n=1 Tax=Arctia plantaginis TaxID=874455 RepID=A0A8S1BJY1_ARCPL|nr:unnamed protein product [Arctia plantaginis]CAB3260403.1 unnamed protein product [Arctia plantaginis]
MGDQEALPVIINIRKPRKCFQPHSVTTKKPMKTKCKEKIHGLPAIAVMNPVPIVTLTKEEVLLPYLRYSKKQEKDRFKKKLGIGIHEQHKLAYTDVQTRMDIDDFIDDCRGITDIDPSFFTCVKCSLYTRYVAPYKSLKYLFNSQLRWRQEVGYRHDCMLNIDINHQKEEEIYDITCQEYKKQLKYLDNFISHDYKKSMMFLSKSEEIKMAVTKKAFELQCLAAVKFTMTSKILGLDYRYGLQQKYGRFLYYLSPPSWRLKNRNFARSVEIEAKGFDFGISSEEDTFNVIFENLKRECDNGLVQPVLYFKHPKDLLEIFDGIEQQQLHHFTHVVRLAPHTVFLKTGIKLFKDIITQDTAGVVNVIKHFEKLLLFCEEKSSQLEKKFFKILNGLFYDSVGAPEVLKLQMHLEFCYAKVHKEKPMNLGILGTAKALEECYMDYSKRMESVTAENIKIALKQFIESERRKFKRSKVAARELCLFERLERALLRAYAPMATKDSPIVYQAKVKRRLQKKTPRPKTTITENTQILTESEIEYLLLFTDWTEKEDPALFLQSLSMVDKN